MARAVPITADGLRKILDCHTAQEYADFDLKLQIENNLTTTAQDYAVRVKSARYEMLKDILAMSNTYSRKRTIDESSYIIIGVAEQTKFEENGVRFYPNLNLGLLRELFDSDAFVNATKDFVQSVLPPIYFHEISFPAFDYDGTTYININIVAIEIAPTLSICRLAKDLPKKSKRTVYPAGTVLYRASATTAEATDQEKIDSLIAEKEAVWRWLNVEQAPSKARQLLVCLERYLAQKFRERPGLPQIEQHYVARNLSRLENPEWSQQEDVAGLILGAPGSGKSSQLIHITWRQATQAIAALNHPSIDLSRVVVPIYLSTQELVTALGANPDVMSACADRAVANAGLANDLLREWVLRKVQAGQALLAIDGWDSASDTQRTMLREALSKLRAWQPPCRVLLASRTEAADQQLRRVFHNEVWNLDPLRDWKSAVRKWAPGGDEETRRASAKNAVEHLNSLDDFVDLWGNPLLLRLACEALWNPLHGAVRRSRRTDLYQHFVEELKNRWMTDSSPDRTLQACFPEFLGELAMSWHQHSPDTRPPLYRLAQEASVATKFGNEGRDLVGDLLKSSLFVASGSDSFEPLHPTLIEFLAAQAMARSTTEPVHRLLERLQMQTGSLLWMLAGQLNNTRQFQGLIHQLCTQCTESFEVPNRDASNQLAEQLAETLTDCLYEAPMGIRVVDTQPFELVTRLLDAKQRKDRRSSQTQWERLMERSQVLRALRAVERTGRASDLELAQKVRGMLVEYLMQRHKLEARERLPPNAVPIEGWITPLSDALECDNPVVRWVGIWLVTSMQLHDIPIDPSLSSQIVKMAETEPCASCQGLITRALGRLLPEDQALTKLQQALNSNAPGRTQSACQALSHLQSREALTTLIEYTERLVRDPTLESDPEKGRQFVGAIGALERFVEIQLNGSDRQRRRVRGRANLAEEVREHRKLRALLHSSLAHPHPKARGSAASALGKLGDLTVWGDLQKIVENCDEKQIRLRASAMFGIQQLCENIEERLWPQTVEWLQKYGEDNSQPNEVRRPALSAIGWLADRGYRVSSGARKVWRVLVALLKDATVPSEVNESAAYALVRFQDNIALIEYEKLLGNQEYNRNEVATLILEQLSKYENNFSLQRLAELINIDRIDLRVLSLAIAKFNHLRNQYYRTFRRNPPQSVQLMARLTILRQHEDSKVAKAAAELAAQIQNP